MAIYTLKKIEPTTKFTALTDTPSSYRGLGGKCVRVKGDESGLEFSNTKIKDLSDANIVEPLNGDTLVYSGGVWQNEAPLPPISAKVYTPSFTTGEVVSKTSNIVYYRNQSQNAINTPQALEGNFLWLVNENKDASQFVSVIPDNSQTVDGSLTPYTVNPDTEVVFVYDESNSDWVISKITKGVGGDAIPLTVGGVTYNNIKELIFNKAKAALNSDSLTVTPEVSVGKTASSSFDTSRVLFPSSDVSVDSRTGDVTVLPTISLSNMSGSAGDSGNINSLRYKYPIKATINTATPNAAFVELDDGYYEPFGGRCCLCYVQEEFYLLGRLNASGNTVDGSIPLREVVYQNSSEMTYNDSTRSIDIVIDGAPDITAIVSAFVTIDGNAPAAGFVRVSVKTVGSTISIQDSNNAPVAIQRNYSSGEKFGNIELANIVNLEAGMRLQLCVEHNFTSTIQIADRLTGFTGMIINEITDSIKSSVGLNQYQLDTGKTIRYATHNFTADDFANFNWLTSNPTNGEQSLAAGSGVQLNGGFRLDAITAIKYQINNTSFNIASDTGIGQYDYIFSKTLSSEKTVMLRGEEISLFFDAAINILPTKLSVVKWTGASDQQKYPIFTSRGSNLIPTLTSGWQFVETYTLDSGEFTLERNFVVPSDAVNIAVIMYPFDQTRTPSIQNFFEFSMNARFPFTGHIVYPMKATNEQTANITSQPLSISMGDFSLPWYEYPIGVAATPLPVGVVDVGYDVVKVNPAIRPITAWGSEKKGTGALVFTKAGTVTLQTTVALFSDAQAGVISRATIYYEKVTNPNSNPVNTQKIAASETEIPVYGGLQDSVPQYGLMKKFTITVQAGDMIVLTAKADSINAIYAMAKTHQPLLTTKGSYTYQ